MFPGNASAVFMSLPRYCLLHLFVSYIFIYECPHSGEAGGELLMGVCTAGKWGGSFGVYGTPDKDQHTIVVIYRLFYLHYMYI